MRGVQEERERARSKPRYYLSSRTYHGEPHLLEVAQRGLLSLGGIAQQDLPGRHNASIIHIEYFRLADRITRGWRWMRTPLILCGAATPSTTPFEFVEGLVQAFQARHTGLALRANTRRRFTCIEVRHAVLWLTHACPER